MELVSGGNELNIDTASLKDEREHTGSSGLLVLLRVDEALLISSIMLVKSLPISSNRSDSFSASLYLWQY